MLWKPAGHVGVDAGCERKEKSKAGLTRNERDEEIGVQQVRGGGKMSAC